MDARWSESGRKDHLKLTLTKGDTYFLKNQNTSVSTMLTMMLVVIGK
jgi:hypothetical protein